MSTRGKKSTRKSANDGPVGKRRKIEEDLEEDDGTGISDEDLISLSVKQVNKLLNGLSPDKVKILKHRRRTLKNRGYAANCREKRTTVKSSLGDQKDELVEEVTKLKQGNSEMKNELNSLQKLHASLLKFKDSKSEKDLKEVLLQKIKF